MDYFEESLALHSKLKWKLDIKAKMPINGKNDLSLLYTPWVAAPCLAIKEDKQKVYDYTFKWNTVAVVSDGSAVLWLWNIWAEAWLPVMEWKAVLFKEFAWINAVPLMFDTQVTEEIIKIVTALAPNFWWINLEDISAPRCFEIESRLKNSLNIPVFHDDQHWTAIVCVAWLINALKITWKNKDEIKVVINGLWAAWTAILKLVHAFWVGKIVVCDSKGVVSKYRDDLNDEKLAILDLVDSDTKEKTLSWALKWADVFIWVSKGNILTSIDVQNMNKDSIIFAMANPIPEIMPDVAKSSWAMIVATWRSDFPNQLNNVLVFPWIFKWALSYRIPKITEEMKMNAAYALANYVDVPNPDKIIPDPLDRKVADVIAESLILSH